jgi:hypothetical protein
LIVGDENRKKLANKDEDEEKPHILVNKKGARYAPFF